MDKKFGHYEIISELGRGGMGVVYKAHEQSLSRYVAIKVLSEALSSDEVVVERFIREARAVASLNHPNVIQVYYAGNEGGQPFFAMEYVKGHSLSKVIRNEAPFSPFKAIGYVLQSARGLAAAHDKGIVHRDIKPANLMITQEGVIKVADFGIAHADDMGSKLTNTGEFVGTPGYLSPEVCTGEEVDLRSDIFALGVVFYEMLTGQTPFQDESPLGMMLEVVKSEVPDVRLLNPDVDALSIEILSKMLEKDPTQRYQNCHELIADIEKGIQDDVFSRKESDKQVQAPPLLVPDTVVGANEKGVTPPTIPRMVDVTQVPAAPPSAQDTVITAVRKQPSNTSWLGKVAMLLALVMVGGGGYYALTNFMGEQGSEHSTNPVLSFMSAIVSDDDSTESKPSAQNNSDKVVESSSVSSEQKGALVSDQQDSSSISPAISTESHVKLASTDSAEQISAINGQQGKPDLVQDEQVNSEQSLTHRQQVAGNAPQKSLEAPGSEDQQSPMLVEQGQRARPITQIRDKLQKLRENKSEQKNQIVNVTPVDPINNWVASSKSRLSQGKPKVLVVIVGERAAGLTAQAELETYLEDAGLSMADVAVMGHGQQGWSADGIDLKRIRRQALKHGVDAVVWLNIRYMGEQTLNYYGRTSQLVTSQVEVKAFRIYDGAKMGRTLRTEARYTSLNLNDQIKAAVADFADKLVDVLTEPQNKA